MSAGPRFYFDQEPAEDNETPYGGDTARIIDEAGGVIAYTHVLTAPALVNLLNTNPFSLDAEDAVHTGPLRLTRSFGGTLPEGTVFVGPGSGWANPFAMNEPAQISEDGRVNTYLPKTPEDSVAVYRRYLAEKGREDVARKHLAGKSLSCWCPQGKPCHADVLLEVANSPET